MKKIELEKQTEREKRFSFISSCIIAATILLAVVQLLLSNHLAGFGRELALLEKREKELGLENELLRSQIAKESSIQILSEKAITRSFEVPSRFLIVEEQETLALLGNNAL